MVKIFTNYNLKSHVIWYFNKDNKFYENGIRFSEKKQKFIGQNGLNVHSLQRNI